MTGLLLFICISIVVVCFVLSFINDYNEEEWRFTGIIFLIVALLFVIAIPISRIESKTNVEYLKVFQQTVNENRENPQDLNVLERTAIIKEINECNMKITTWKTKGQKWYNNKWYYHPSVQEAEYVK